MQVQTLHLRNFRRFESAHVGFHPRFNVLIGENGMGKTTVVDALSIMLGTYFQGSSRLATHSARTVKSEDSRAVVRDHSGNASRESEDECFLEAKAIIGKMPIHWIRSNGDRGGQAKEVIQKGKEDRESLAHRENHDLPLLLYYGTQRLWGHRRDVQTQKPGSRLEAYRNCLDPRSDQKAFQKWFKRLSFTQLQHGQAVPALTAVNNAVCECIPEATIFYHDTSLDEIFIKLDEHELTPFDGLSAGYRNMVAMVADIAYRASLLNPHLLGRAALETEGVVLIDELDLHLHPKWQRTVVGSLQKAFPKLQFITTTHSPFVIQSLSKGQIIDLQQLEALKREPAEPAEYAVPGPSHEYAERPIEDIVEELMGVELPQRGARHQQMHDAARQYYALLDEGGDADPETKEKLKIQLDELSAPFSDNIAYHAFLEMERLAAGLGPSKKRDS